VNEVVLNAEAEVAADRARGRFRSVGQAHEQPARSDRFTAFPHHGHRRPAGEERQEAFVERLALVNRVVLLGEIAARLHELQPDEAKALLLESSDDFANETTLHGVRFQQDQRLLHLGLVQVMWCMR
jgi:hypothetical protein